MSTFDEVCARIAANDPDMQYADRVSFDMNDEQTIRLASALLVNTSLESLAISIRNMSTESARELARVLRANKTMRSLRINCQRNGECARELISALNDNTTVDSLTLIIWQYADCMRAIEYVIATSKTLRTFALYTLRSIDITPAIRANTSITHLDLSECAFDKRALFNVLRAQNITIRKLYLSDVIMRDEDTRELTRMLLVNTTLTLLALPHTGIEQQGAREIAHALRINRTLQSLDLRGCRMCDDGIIAIANALTNANCTLEHLNVSNCRITSIGIDAIVRMLRGNTSLATLDISKNGVGKNEACELASALEANAALRLLSVCRSRSAFACGKRTWILLEAFVSVTRTQRSKDGMHAIVRAARDPHSPLSLLPGDGTILRDICKMCKVPPIIITHQ
jgi:Ran GTPase-activating protein (RanGAP) involved in mRNA processing and transport